MKYFLIDDDLKISYEDLIKDLNSSKEAPGAYGILLSILKSISSDRIFRDIEDLISYIKLNSDKLYISIQTSGTTGDPKKISQSVSNVIRHVKDTSCDFVWGFAYNPSHFAGLQVLFQSLFNKNTIVFVFGKDFKDIPNILAANNVTHISCTPTFMSMIIPYLFNFASLTNVSFGGERLSEKVLNKVKDIFPDIKLRNIYASSEAGSILSSNDSGFYIPQRYLTLVKIEEDQLYIHRDLLGDFKFEGDWYPTGDFVSFMDDIHFTFDARSSEIVNTGGYRVSLAKIEKVIRDLPEVEDAVVYSKKNSVIGSIIVADIISSSDIEHLKYIIKTTDKLLDYEKPRIVKIVEHFDMTNTGKIKRK